MEKAPSRELKANHQVRQALGLRIKAEGTEDTNFVPHVGAKTKYTTIYESAIYSLCDFSEP